MIFVYVGICFLIPPLFGFPYLRPITGTTASVWWTYTLICLTFPTAYHLAAFHLGYLRTRRREGASGGGLVRAWEIYRRERFTPFRIFGVVVGCALLAPMMTTFLAYKRAIPLFLPFAWDTALMRADRALHLGVDPWRWLQPLFGGRLATVVIDTVYVGWLPVIALVLAWQLWTSDRTLRTQFLLSYLISSILVGTVLATVFSSAGPCYWREVVGEPDPFAPLMARLREIDALRPLNALRLQQILWDGYLGKREFYGISAMPSMHVALPVLYVLAGFRTSRLLGWLFALYLAVILIGSVHLGWHYAIDGYASIALVLVVWAAVGRALQRSSRTEREAGIPET